MRGAIARGPGGTSGPLLPLGVLAERRFRLGASVSRYNSSVVHVFGSCELNLERSELHRDGRLIPLAPKAIEVLRYLIESHGFDGQRLTAGGYGEQRPIGDNTTTSGKAANRRVELVVLSDVPLADVTGASIDG